MDINYSYDLFLLRLSNCNNRSQHHPLAFQFVTDSNMLSLLICKFIYYLLYFNLIKFKHDYEFEMINLDLIKCWANNWLKVKLVCLAWLFWHWVHWIYCWEWLNLVVFYYLTTFYFCRTNISAVSFGNLVGWTNGGLV